MENASKALVMAGGILIALLVIGALLLMFNQIGSYEKAQTTNVKDSQLAQFNADFERYTDDSGISGADLISLANKIIDYNNKKGVSNSVNYDIKMELKVSNMGSFRKKYGYSRNSDALFLQDIYTINKDNKQNALKVILDKYNSTDPALLKKVSSLYDATNLDESEKKIKKALTEIDMTRYSDWNFSSNDFPTKLQIQNYKEYSEFKTSKFIIEEEPVYEDGQISYLHFSFKE